MELYFKTVLVFGHFALAAFCLVTVVGIDLRMLREYAAPASRALCDQVARAKRTMMWALAGLWATGLAIVAHGMATQPAYLDNQKLWFKVFVVVVLSLNGILVHRAGRILQPGVTLAALDDRTALLVNLAGATSSISWLWACFLGTARAWNGTLSFDTILLYYLSSLAVGLGVAAGMHMRRRRAMRGALAD